jgi:hypothetical protein
VEPKLRSCDRIFDHDHAVLVAMPDTSAVLAKEFAYDALGALARDGLIGTVRWVNTATAVEATDPLAFIAKATGKPPEVAAGG